MGSIELQRAEVQCLEGKLDTWTVTDQGTTEVPELAPCGCPEQQVRANWVGQQVIYRLFGGG
jgi:hypothetical protein